VTRILSAQEYLEEAGPDAVTVAARHACWRRGDLSYLLHEGRAPGDPVVERYVPPRLRGTGPRGQTQALAAIEEARARGADLFALRTGRQWGKSLLFATICAQLCVRSCLEKSEPVRIPYAAPSAKQVSEFILPHFERIALDAPPDLAPTYQAAASSWVFPNGSRVVLAGCEDQGKAERLRGPRAHLAIVDEAGFVPIVDYVIESVLGWQLATTGGMLLLSSTPPVSLDHPFVALWERAVSAGASFTSTTPEAPHMSAPLLEKAITRSGGESTIAWRREGLAELLADPEIAVLPEFSASEVTVAEHERPAWLLPHVIGDGGFEDMGVFLFGYYDFARDVDVIEDEVVVRRTRSDALDALIAAKERELWPGLTVHRRRVDAPPQVRADMSREEWAGEDAPHWQGVTKPPSRFGSMQAGVNEARIRLARGAVRIHPRCQTLIAHCTSARWTPSRDGFVRVRDSRGEPLHHYDGAAALVYFLRDLDRVSNPAPMHAPENVVQRIHIEREERAKNNSLRTLFGGRKGQR
jgi:hypothetical protein